MKRTAVITGASSGIGFALARLFAREGWRLILVARDEARLRTAGELLAEEAVGGLTLRSCDLADPAKTEELAWELKERAEGVDALVNNAGFGWHGGFAEMEPRVMRDMVETNVNSVALLTRHLLPWMVGMRAGRILNVASLAGFAPGPLMAVYYATKAFVLSFSEALHEETRGTGVTVTALCPGPVATGFQERAGFGGGRAGTGLFVPDAEAVARAGYRGMMRGAAVVVPGFLNKLTVGAVRAFPRALVRRAAHRRLRRIRRA